MNVCFVASEVAPYAKTGGLADVSGALPKYIGANGHDIRVFMPWYSTIDVSKQDYNYVEYLKNTPIDFGGEIIRFSVLTTNLPGTRVPIFFIDCPRFYNRGSIYTDQADEYLRFAVLSRAAIECCQRMGWAPDIMHCNDWQTALIPLYLQTVYHWDKLFHRTRTVLTIHNTAYQGVFSSSVIQKLGLRPYINKLDREDTRSGMINYLKTGLFYCDVITTVSNTYAREIQTAEFGSGLQHLLRSRRSSLVGIVNGVDYNEWSPEKDPLIHRHYSMRDLRGKEVNKKNLLHRMQLPYNPGVPVLGIVSRLTAQKGFELFFETLVPLLHSYDLRLCVLGSGEERYEKFFQNIHTRFRHKVCFYRGFQNELAHLIEAGSDIFLMPSRFEPCGLNQIYSLRYGTIPVVRKTGGLADTVQQFDPNTGQGTGFVFEHFTARGLLWGVETALKTYRNRDVWRHLMRNAMSQNYSWEVQVQKYLSLYSAITGIR